MAKRGGYSGSSPAEEIGPPTPIPSASMTVGPAREAALAAAVERAYDTWRNRPGRASPALVREALLDAATRAYDARED